MKLGTETSGQSGVPPELDDVTGAIIDAALKIHKDLGPGLLESVYEALLAKELERRGFHVERQKVIRWNTTGWSSSKDCASICSSNLEWLWN